MPDQDPAPGEFGQPQPPAVVSLDLTPIRVGLSKYDQGIAEMEAQAQVLAVSDGESLNLAVRMAARAKQVETAIEKARKRVVGPPGEYVKNVNFLARAYQTRFASVAQLLKDKIAVYQAEAREREQQAALEAAQALQEQMDAQARAQGREPVQLPPPVLEESKAVVRTAFGSAHLKKEWTFAVTDPDQVPREYLVVDERAIRAAVKQGVRSIPGVEIFQEDRVTIRS